MGYANLTGISAVPEPTTGDYLVRFIDDEGTIYTQYVDAGNDAILPTLVDRDLLTFVGCNVDYTNIQQDTDVGLIYKTTDDKTYLFMSITRITGKTPSITLNKATTDLMIVTWGDGETATTSASGIVTLSKVNDYTIGYYQVSIECVGNYRLSSYVFGNNVNYNSCLTKCYLSNNILSLDFNAFSTCYSLVSIVLPNSILSIRTSTFGTCYSLIIVVVPNSVIFIGLRAFYQCYSLALIIGVSAVESIGDRAFYECCSLTSTGSLASTTLLDVAAFARCYALPLVVVPDSMLSVGSYAFLNCYALVSYHFESTTPPTLVNINAFTGINKIARIYVPDASVTAYKTATNWITYAEYIYPESEM